MYISVWTVVVGCCSWQCKMAVLMPHIDVDLSYLSESEQAQIRDVVERDELLRQQLLQHIQSV